MMGLPRSQIAPGGRYRYEFTMLDRAGTYWYHAMSADSTPQQVYFGLAGLTIVSDAEESALTLPRGVDDLPLSSRTATGASTTSSPTLAAAGPVGTARTRQAAAKRPE